MSEEAKTRSKRKTRRAGRKYQQRKRRALLIQLLNEEGIEVPGVNAPPINSEEKPISDTKKMTKNESVSPVVSEQLEST